MHKVLLILSCAFLQRGMTTETRSRLWGKNKFGILSASAVSLHFGGYGGIDNLVATAANLMS